MAESEGAGNRPDHPGVLIRPPRLFAAALVAGALLDLIVPLPLLPARAGLVPGAIVGGVGLALAFWCFGLFRRAGTNVPTNRPVTALVTDGPYRITRNPIYVAMTLLAVGISAAFNSAWMLGLLVPTFVVLNIGVIAREERYLAAKFGADYAAYRARVRRWI